MKKILAKKRIVLLILALLFSLIFSLVIFFALVREGRAALETIRLAKNIYPVIKNKEEATIGKFLPPKKVQYKDGQDETMALIFSPQKKGKSGAVIVSWGVGFTSENVRLLFNFADVLRNSGLTVLIPLPKTLLLDIVSDEGIKSYVNAFKFLEKDPAVDLGKIGLIGFCAGGSFTILAAEDEEIADRVSFILAFAPYANLADYYAQGLTQKALTDGQVRNWTPHELTWRILLKNWFFRYGEKKDSQILYDYFVYQKEEAEKQLGELSPQGKLALEALQTQDPQKIFALMKLLPENMQKDLTDLSPVTKVANLKTKVFIIHDVEDPFTPYEESVRLAQVLGEKASLAKVTTFDHTILDKNFSLFQFVKELKMLFRQLYQIFYLLN